MPKKTLVGVEDVDFKIVSYVDGMGEQHTCLAIVRPETDIPAEVYLFEENLKTLGAVRAAGWLQDLVLSGIEVPKKGKKRDAKKTAGRATARASRPRQV